MGFKLNIDFDTPPNMVFPTEKIRKDITRFQVRYIQGAQQIALGELQKNSPHGATHTLFDSWQPWHTVYPDKIEAGVATPVAYALYVERGTRPHWPPIEPLKLWALRKHHDIKIAYIAQRAIARRGTKGKFMVLKTWLKIKNPLNQMAERMRDRIVQAMAKS